MTRFYLRFFIRLYPKLESDTITIHEVVDVDNDEPSIILLLSMIDEGNVARIDQIHYFIDPFDGGAPC